MMKYIIMGCVSFALSVSMSQSVFAENLYKPGQTPALTADVKATNVGDILTVIIVQNAEARNSARNVTDRSSRAGGSFSTQGTNEGFDISLGRDYTGIGEVRRSESFITQMSATVSDVYQNGDLQIAGTQFLQINGETTQIDILGRVRRYDIAANNTVLSTRIANAEIRYEGEGFVSDSARPGLLTRIFNALGLI